MPRDQNRRPSSHNELDPLLTGYSVPHGHFDELLERDGTVRPWWASFAAHARYLNAAHLSSVQARITRQIHENGATHTVYAADGRSRPWMLDALPLILPAAEWTALAHGLRQHARLLNAVAADLYGPQHLLHEGLVPPAIVFRHPGFLRACHGVEPPGGIFVHSVAFDLARDEHGRWRVVNTRAQTPAGAGYALENRATILRMFPDTFRDLQVQAVAPFFATLKEMLLAAAPCDEASPHAVLLTPGPYSGRYFEHAYLARYFGFPLVEGADLTVRHDRVFLKTISGLRQVHAILRHLNDNYCDPLELRSDSALGVPGLVQAWRAGRVLVANAFGTSILESPALLGLLPALCPRLLGEPLESAVLRTWWCGDATALEDASSRLKTAVVKSAFPTVTMEPLVLSNPGADRGLEWAARLGHAADDCVVEELVPLSHAPVWHDGRLESRALMLRVFLVADGRGDYSLMTGGLSRIAGDQQPTVSNQPGGGSKDTWVLSDAPLGPPPVAPRSVSARDTIHTERAVSSRAAENLFWLGRYAERAETSARLLRTALTRLSDPATRGVSQPSFLRACLAQGLLDPSDFDDPEGSVKRDTTTDSVPDFTATSASVLTRRLIDNLFDRQSRRSLGFNVQQTVRAAAAIRDRLSSDNWRLLNLLFKLVATPPPAPLDLDDALAIVDRSIVSLVAVGGLEMAHMTRDHGWRFLSLGRHLERLLLVAATFDAVAHEDPADPALLEWLLELSDSLVAFRARYVRQPEWPAVVELLLFDAHNPRSLLFQLGKLGKHVRLLPGAAVMEVEEEISRLEQLCLAVDSPQGDLFVERTPMDDLLGDCQTVALRVSDALTARYFSHAYELSHTTTSG
jgi:uncharacterized circularly permuted ATP-grasp superfamily protein/uncharacterized alpha-E superfamily protein